MEKHTTTILVESGWEGEDNVLCVEFKDGRYSKFVMCEDGATLIPGRVVDLTSQKRVFKSYFSAKNFRISKP